MDLSQKYCEKVKIVLDTSRKFGIILHILSKKRFGDKLRYFIAD